MCGNDSLCSEIARVLLLSAILYPSAWYSVFHEDNKADKAFLTFCNVKHRGAMKFDSIIFVRDVWQKTSYKWFYFRASFITFI